jgi:kynurenine formamidase
MLGKLFQDQITEGEVYDLGLPYHTQMPHFPAAPPFKLDVTKMHTDSDPSQRYGACREDYTLSIHMGTHIDALGHVSYDDKFFGGITASENQTRGEGLLQRGIEEVPPLTTRGVLLDVAKLKGVAVLPTAYEITKADLLAALELTGTTINPGDAVFIRTGWSRYFDDPDRYLSPDGAPGPGTEAAEWLADAKIRLVGSDTHAFEKLPSANFPVHVILLVQNGIHIMEWMNLEPLSEAGVFTFVSIVLPLKIVGASGSPVRPIAIR